MSATSLMFWNDMALKGVPRVLRLEYKITAAKTVSPQPQSSVSYTTFDAIASQSVIDNFLGTTNEFLVAAFDATAMGADTFGGLVNMNGQAKVLTSFNARCYSGTGGATLVERSVVSSSTLTASTLVTECALGASGNLAFKVDFGNTPDFDALTSGLIVIELSWIAK
jgi:hypothetical protein